MSNPLLETHTLPPFDAIRPEHIQPAVEKIIDENRAGIAKLLETVGDSAANFETGVLPIEELGERLHQVWAPVSHLHGVVNTPELREAYNACLPLLARYGTEVGQNEGLFRLYERIAANMPADRNDGAPALLRLALRQFRLNGIGLPENKKQQFKTVMEQLTQYQASFEQNVLDAMSAWRHHETRREKLAGIPDATLEQAAANAKAENVDGWLFHLDQPTYIAIVTHAENRDLRHRLYRAWITRASDQSESAPEFDNSDNIERILALRHEAARLVGFDNYAEYSIESKMASSSSEVLDFLENLARKSHAAAAQELAELEDFAGKELTAWDVAYYSEKLRLQKYAISDEELRPFFPLDKVLDGLFVLVSKIYQLNVRPGSNFPAWHDDVRFFEILDQGGQPIGAIYMDLFARSGKRSGAWMDECVIRRSFNGNTQNPVAHLVCNFAPPTKTLPSLLTHTEVTTLFHEFGHTLHHLLTTVDYPSVSGINGVPWDAVELPSQFMENFAWQPDVVTMISGHHRTAEPLPVELLDKLRASRVYHAGLHMVRQIELAMLDLKLHAGYDPAQGSRLAEVLGAVRKHVAVIPQPDFNRLAHSFTHIFGGGYAAGYYSYKWAEVLAADAWSAFEEGGILNPDVARRFRHSILEVGGTVDIAEAFRTFRGRDPDIQPLLVQSGILPEHDQPAAV